MFRFIIFGFSVLLLFLSFTPVYAGCDSATVLNIYDKELKNTGSSKLAATKVVDVLGGSFKPSASLKELIDIVTGGKRLKDKETFLKITRAYRIDPKTLKSYKLVDYYKSIDVREEPSLSRFSSTFKAFGDLVSVTSLMINIDKAILAGDRKAILDIYKQAYEYSTSVVISKAAMRGAQVGIAVTGFLDYALTSLMVQELDGYEEYWWLAYSHYLNKKYPKMVQGKQSWAVLAMKNDNGKQFKARLMEFWANTDVAGDGISSAIERAAHYYKAPKGLRRGDALAMVKFQSTFASRYYNDYLRTTMDTYIKRTIDKEKQVIENSLNRATTNLCGYWADLNAVNKEFRSEMNKAKVKNLRINVYTCVEGANAIEKGICVRYSFDGAPNKSYDVAEVQYFGERLLRTNNVKVRADASGKVKKEIQFPGVTNFGKYTMGYSVVDEVGKRHYKSYFIDYKKSENLKIGESKPLLDRIFNAAKKSCDEAYGSQKGIYKEKSRNLERVHQNYKPKLKQMESDLADAKARLNSPNKTNDDIDLFNRTWCRTCPKYEQYVAHHGRYKAAVQVVKDQAKQDSMPYGKTAYKCEMVLKSFREHAANGDLLSTLNEIQDKPFLVNYGFTAEVKKMLKYISSDE